MKNMILTPNVTCGQQNLGKNKNKRLFNFECETFSFSSLIALLSFFITLYLWSEILTCLYENKTKNYDLKKGEERNLK